MRAHPNCTFTPHAWLTLAMVVTSVGVAQGQQVPSDSTRPVLWPAWQGTYRHTQKSQVNGRDYHIAVGLPQGYALPGNAATRYPVLYLLDGGISFPEAQITYKVQARANDSLIIVGLWSPDGLAGRGIDYRPPPWEHSGEEVLSRSRAGTCCRADLFLRVLREEIIPLIDRQYRTTRDRGLFGHSAGGLFANYVLFEAPDLFERYGIASASLGTDNRPLFTREAEFARTHSALRKQVFFSVGSEECPVMCYLTQRMAATLQARNYEGLSLTSVVLDGENHSSGGWISRALRQLYLSIQSSEPEDKSDVADSARRITQEYLTAFAQMSTERILGLLAGDSAFHGIVNGKMVRERESYRTLLQQRFAMIRSVDMRVKSIQVSTLGDPRSAIATAAYTTRTHLRSGQSTWNDGELSFEFERRPEGWRIIYLLDAGIPPSH